jgi:hypothetical protein
VGEREQERRLVTAALDDDPGRAVSGPDFHPAEGTSVRQS